MRTHNINTLIFFLAGMLISIQSQGCYTIVKHPDRSYLEDRYSSFSSQTSDSCVVEGMVRYFELLGGREVSRPAGYHLDNIFWLRNPPPINFRYVSIDRKTAKSYLNKYVRIKGRFRTPFSAFYYSSETMSVSIKISEIEIIAE